MAGLNPQILESLWPNICQKMPFTKINQSVKRGPKLVN